MDYSPSDWPELLSPGLHRLAVGLRAPFLLAQKPGADVVKGYGSRFDKHGTNAAHNTSAGLTHI